MLQHSSDSSNPALSRLAVSALLPSRSTVPTALCRPSFDVSLTRSLDGYAEIEASFGRCTFCHRRKPGSKKLTRAGKGFASVLGNMEGLVEWVKDRHPGWPEPDAADLEVDIEVTTDPPAEAEPESEDPPPLPAH